MLPVLTDNCRKVFEQAQQEARKLNQEFVGTEHLILAIANTPSTHALRTLKRAGVDLDELRTEIRSVLGYSETPPSITGPLPLSPKLQRTMNTALVTSRSVREPKLSTRILLLTMIEEPGATIRSALNRVGADIDALSQKLATKPEEPEA
jgi:ATP-dependent Clp protease ATP-binding subunit ClpC